MISAAPAADALPAFEPRQFTDPADALEYAHRIYRTQVTWLRAAAHRFMSGQVFEQRVRACYPYVRIQVDSVVRPDSRLSYGFVEGPGCYETTLTRTELFGDYLYEQFRLLLRNHGVSLEVGVSTLPIPVHFSFAVHEHFDAGLDPVRLLAMRDRFDLPDLAAMDDGIANGTHDVRPGEAWPLSLFTGPRIDYSLHRLRHYTGTSPTYFQNFVLFTNYQFYIDEFVRHGRELMARPISAAGADGEADEDGYLAFVEPGNRVTVRAGAVLPQALVQSLTEPLSMPLSRMPQMPAYHLLRSDRSGITMVNIGVGPANAKTITDHIAVLRPHAWLMLGHCAGLRNTQRLGDYVLAHGYVREDHVLDEDLPLWVPIPALAEVQVALEEAVAEVTQLRGFELKRILRTGTVASVDNRNWELLPPDGPVRRFSQSRAVALDMESATIAANGFRFRVPYGTLLCVSDKPLHGEIKLPGMANRFYNERVEQHLQIGMRAIELLRTNSLGRLHSRKLRSFAEVAFQ